METKVVASINGVNILASAVSEGLVPVKPICEALGVAFQSQNTKLKEHPIYSSVVTLSLTTGADGKQYEMTCIPIEFLSGWLFSINPANVKEEAKKGLIQFQLQCNQVLFYHFFGRQKRQIEQNAIEIALLEEIAELKKNRGEINKELSDKERKLEAVRKDD